MTRLLPLVEAMVDPLTDAAQKAAESIGRLARAVCEAASAAVKALSDAMSRT